MSSTTAEGVLSGSRADRRTRSRCCPAHGEHTEVFVEGIEMLKRGGMMLEMGNFADTGEININVHRTSAARTFG